MSPAQSALLESFERLADWGAMLVIIGVAGEGVEIVLKICKHKVKRDSFLKWYDKHEYSIEIWGAIFWIIVVVGLGMEFRYGHKAQQLVKNENTRITQEAGEARKIAGQAELKSAEANEHAAKLEFEAEQLRGQNLKLARDFEKLRHPRWLTFNGRAFQNALKGTPKMDVQIWYPPDDAESSSLINLELVPALESAGWNISEVRQFVPVHSSEFHFSNPYSVQIGLNNNPIDILVGTDIFWKTVGDVWDRDDIKTAPKSISKAFEDSGICWDSVTPKAHWGGNPIPTNAIRIIVFPKTF